MTRYDFELHSDTYEKHQRWRIFDRNKSHSEVMAIVFDVGDAELICNALNEREKHATDTSLVPSTDVRPDGVQDKPAG